MGIRLLIPEDDHIGKTLDIDNSEERFDNYRYKNKFLIIDV
jgi:hypothetical protein